MGKLRQAGKLRHNKGKQRHNTGKLRNDERKLSHKRETEAQEGN